MTTLWQDLRYAARMLRKSPGFVIIGVFTWLSQSAQTRWFASLNALILRPLEVPHPESLYLVQRASDNSENESYANYVDLRDRNRSFEASQRSASVTKESIPAKTHPHCTNTYPGTPVS